MTALAGVSEPERKRKIIGEQFIRVFEQAAKKIGVVLNAIFGRNMKDGSIGKISENRFARADLEHVLVCVDDDMKMEALKQTNYVKSS